MSGPQDQEARNIAESDTQKLVEETVFARLNAVRIIVVALIGIGYASTLSIGPGSREWLHTLGYDPSWYGIQVLFFLSGWLAWRSLSSGRGIRAFLLSRAKRILPWVMLYTFVVTAVLYPLLCDHTSPLAKDGWQLGVYFLKTVTLIDPGGPMPGALDNALYACIFQGAIWTLRWGAIAYAGLILLSLLRAGTASLTILFGLCLAAHLSISHWSLQSGNTLLDPLMPGLRLGYAFLLGCVTRSIRHSLAFHWHHWIAISASCLGLAALHYYALPWTHLIEVLASIGWCALAMAVLLSPINLLRGWPNLTLPLYLGVWPIGQLLLYLYPAFSVMGLVVATLTVAFALALILKRVARLIKSSFHRRIQPA